MCFKLPFVSSKLLSGPTGVSLAFDKIIVELRFCGVWKRLKAAGKRWIEEFQQPGQRDQSCPILLWQEENGSRKREGFCHGNPCGNEPFKWKLMSLEEKAAKALM